MRLDVSLPEAPAARSQENTRFSAARRSTSSFQLRLNGGRGCLDGTARSDQGQAGGSGRESGGQQEQDEDGEERR